MKKFAKLCGIIVLAAAGLSFTTYDTRQQDPGVPLLYGTAYISGIAEVGQTLTADTSALGGSGDISFQWRRGNSSDIGFGGVYIVQPEDVGYTITLTLRRSGNAGSIVSYPTDVVPVPLAGTVRIDGITQVGEVLTANATDLGGSGTILFQWMRNGVLISYNSNTYVV
ncbi:MAG: hypothetical protein FWC64_13570 [Treponema sp.]|nr:hypothetical protein [Treponema sp.]